MAEQQVGVAVLGVGNIGGAVARAIVDDGAALARSSGVELRFIGGLARSRASGERAGLDPELITTDGAVLVDRPDVHVVVEALGGEQPAADLMLRALAAGKHVVTANKEAVSKHLPAIITAARDGNSGFLCEASVGGGIPLIVSLRQILATNRVERIRGIVNGTTNFILSKMDAEGADYAATLREAQELGYAEPDPTADVEGYDAVYKLAVLATLLFGQPVHPDAIGREGITGLQAADLHHAAARGYAVKLLAVARRAEDGVEARVAPVLVPLSDGLAGVRGVFNAVQLDGDLVGRVLLSGRGAGPGPTASAILGDLAAVIAGGAPDPLLLPATGDGVPVSDGAAAPARRYLRLPIAAPEAAERARPFLISALGPGGVEEMAVAEGPDGLDLVVITGPAPAERAAAAVEALRPLAGGGPATVLRVEE